MKQHCRQMPSQALKIRGNEMKKIKVEEANNLSFTLFK